MNNGSDILNRVHIAAPCDVDWNTMDGDERTRFCHQCKLNVYNVAEMSAEETRELLQNTEGRLCMRLYRRRDGTIITDNCPVGLKELRDQLRRCAVLLLSMLASIGIISSAQAQGLVGAPVDPRYGVSGQVRVDAEVIERGVTLFAGGPASIILMLLVSRIARRRYSLSLVGAGFAVTFLVFGLATGLSGGGFLFVCFAISLVAVLVVLYR